MIADSFEELLQKAYPNPARTGCPGSVRLRQMVDNPPALDDPAVLHVRECSPCFAEFSAYRDARRSKERRAATLRLSAAACLLCASFGVYSVVHRTEHKSNHASGVAANAPMEIAKLDFSNDSAERGADDSAGWTQPTVKPTARLFQILIPTNSEPGSYEIEIRSAASLSRTVKPLETTPLEHENQKLSLTYQMADSSLPSGAYAAAWRLRGTALWHYGFFVVGP